RLNAALALLHKALRTNNSKDILDAGLIDQGFLNTGLEGQQYAMSQHKTTDAGYVPAQVLGAGNALVRPELEGHILKFPNRAEALKHEDEEVKQVIDDREQVCRCVGSEGDTCPPKNVWEQTVRKTYKEAAQRLLAA